MIGKRERRKEKEKERKREKKRKRERRIMQSQKKSINLRRKKIRNTFVQRENRSQVLDVILFPYIFKEFFLHKR